MPRVPEPTHAGPSGVGVHVLDVEAVVDVLAVFEDERAAVGADRMVRIALPLESWRRPESVLDAAPPRSMRQAS